jgi:hypothetical protein
MSKPPSNSKHRNFAKVLRHPIAALHSWALSARPMPDGDIGDGVVIGDEVVLREPAIEHAVEWMRLFEIACSPDFGNNLPVLSAR